MVQSLFVLSLGHRLQQRSSGAYYLLFLVTCPPLPPPPVRCHRPQEVRHFSPEILNLRPPSDPHHSRNSLCHSSKVLHEHLSPILCARVSDRFPLPSSHSLSYHQTLLEC